jgi:hypothetical protein
VHSTYEPLGHIQDQIGTFIFADSISCQPRTVAEIVRESSVEKHPSFKVNMIASVKDYCTTYYDNRQNPWMYPLDAEAGGSIIPDPLPLNFALRESTGYKHLKLFLRYLELIINRTTILYPELTQYFDFSDIRYVEEHDL